ncbi:(d)CMP kinase [Oscillatoria laete-virens NRMC-F 0139]|nr:(d)CMP kinase [Oscillatoria laete-virens]MDL5054669.1 (d)CMP kinase [Oscillatoria laete-virens NRMC-F 0139]
MIIAIDGPSASGKSTVSRGIARELGCLYVDTGAMYRALTWRALKDGIDYRCEETLTEWVRAVTLSAVAEKGAVNLLVNGEKIEDAWLRTPEINATVSWLAKTPAVRALAVAVQRDLRRLGSLVAEGRDMGTVVFRMRILNSTSMCPRRFGPPDGPRKVSETPLPSGIEWTPPAPQRPCAWPMTRS